MKSVKDRIALRRLKTVTYRLSFFVEVALLLVGYVFLSPDNCEAGLRFCARVTGLFTDGDLLPVMPFVRKVVPPLILYWAVMFVFGLFRPLPIRRFWLWIIWGLLGFVCWFLPYPLEGLSRYYDAFYASVTLVFVAGLIASQLYGISRSGGATALALIIFVVIGTVLYEKLASIGVFQFHVERWLRPEQILDSVFGVIDKQKDIADVASLQNRIVYCVYYFFHALLAFFGGYVIIGFVSKAAVNMMLLRFSRTPDSVFWGVSPEAITLAKSLKRERGEECVFVVSDIKSVEGNDLDRLSDEGFLWVIEGHGSLSMIAHRVNKHFFITPSGSANVEWATRLSKVVGNEPDVYVCIDDETDDSRLFRWANSPDICGKMNVHIIRETSLAADMLLRDHPMLRSPGVKCGNGTAVFESSGAGMAFRLLQIGFGAQGRMLLNRTICDAQAPGTSFSAVVIDASRSAFDLYNVRSQEVSKKYGVSFKEFDVRRKAFYDWLSREISNSDYTRIVVTTGDDELNLFVADFIVRNYLERAELDRLKDLPEILFVRVRHPEKYAGFLPRANDSSPQAEQSNPRNVGLCFTPFGSDQEVYSCQSIVDFDIDVIAKKINAYYCGTNDKQKAWREASFFDRESSRGSAMGLRNLCRLAVGKEPSKAEGLEEWEKWEASVRKAWEGMKFNKDGILARLVDAEHLRWMAYHYVRGIKTWDPECQPYIITSIKDRFDNNIEKKITKLRKENVPDKVIAKQRAEWVDAFRIRANQREEANRHAALIPTERLFRLDIYLDIKSFENRASSLFTLYAKALQKKWDETVKHDDHFLAASFESDKVLYALNRCVFTYMDIRDESNSLHLVKEKIQEALDKFAEEIQGCMTDDSKSQEYNTADKLRQALNELQDKVTKCLPEIKWYSFLFNRRARVSLEKFKKNLEDGKSRVGFRTLGNLVGNDIDIIEHVLDHLEIGEEIENG